MKKYSQGEDENVRVLFITDSRDLREGMGTEFNDSNKRIRDWVMIDDLRELTSSGSWGTMRLVPKISLQRVDTWFHALVCHMPGSFLLKPPEEWLKLGHLRSSVKGLFLYGLSNCYIGYIMICFLIYQHVIKQSNMKKEAEWCSLFLMVHKTQVLWDARQWSTSPELILPCVPISRYYEGV